VHVLVHPRGRGSNATGLTGASRIGHTIGGTVANDGTATLTNSTFDHNEPLGGGNNPGGPIAYQAPDLGSGRADPNRARTDPACGPTRHRPTSTGRPRSDPGPTS